MIDTDKIQAIVRYCGKYLPDNIRISSYQLAIIIKDKYSLTNPIMLDLFEYIRNNNDIKFIKHGNRIRVTKI